MMAPQDVDRDAPTEACSANAPEFSPGVLLVAGRFKIIDHLGSGGMGAVYKARDRTLKKQVALKLRHIRKEETLHEASRRRQLFLDEVAKAQRITSPHVCRIFDIHEHDGREVISMEFIDGEDLAELLLRIDRLIPHRAIKLGRQICDGLAAIHRVGLFHQDLKPHNVLIDRGGRAKVSDLGLAGRRFLGGTPQYTAPEQLLKRRVSVQSDLYAFGLVLYEMFTGRRAFVRSSLLDPSPSPLSELVPEIDSEVERIVRLCLRVNPLERPRSATEVANVLSGALSRAHSGTPNGVSRELTWWRSPIRWAQAVGLSAVIATLILRVSGPVGKSAPHNPVAELLPPSVATSTASVMVSIRGQEQDGSKLVHVPGGVYELGADELGEDSRAHSVKLSPFWIGRVPVTKLQYERFLGKNPEMSRPMNWRDITFSNPWQPVVGVNWEEAQAYCHWAGMELPTEAQWEAAARGAGERQRYPYPWGDEEPDISRAHFNRRRVRGEESAPGQPEPVGSFPQGVGPHGTLDQAGNVWEWCLDAWNPNAYQERRGHLDPVEQGTGAPTRVVRGGSWESTAKELHVAYRAYLKAELQRSEVGFRCVLLADR